MKKKIIVLFLILILTGCKLTTKQINKENKKVIKNTKIEETKKEEYIDNNPIKLGIYMYYNSYTNRRKLNEYTTNWQLNVDLCSLEIFYTNEENIPSDKIKNLWQKYKDNYDNINNYKIGYNISFETKNEGTINKNILSPKDTNDNSIYKYMQIYLYDDVNQKDNAWYSHVTEEEYNENTILTSIKLTGSTLTNEIISDITLTAFTYDEDDFDEQGNYRGISKEKIIIKRN